MNPSTVAGRLTSRRRTLASAAVVAVTLGMIGMLYAALAPRGQASTSADPAVQRGQALYNQGCSSCHGFSGSGGNRAPSLIGVGAAAVDFQVGTGRMPLANASQQAPRKKPQYTPEEVSELSAYVATLAPGPAIPSEEYTDASGASDEVPDKQGRVTIPPVLRSYAGLTGECTVIGAGNRVEVWDTAAWSAYLDQVEPAFAERSEEVVPGVI